MIRRIEVGPRKASALVLSTLSSVLVFVHQAQAADAQGYPSRPVRIVVPFPPGGSTDPMARLVAAKLGERWDGATIVVDNRPGGNTVIGISIVARAVPDGYTMGYGSGPMYSTPSLLSNMPYNVLTDLVGVTGVAKTRSVLVIHPSVPAKTLKELVALAKAKPGELKYGASGIGTSTHLSAELFQRLTKTNLLQVPYKGSGPLTIDLLTGRVNLSFQTVITQIPNIVTGRLRALAVSGEGRVRALPDVPNFDEAGLPGFGLTSWTCLVAPTGTPKGIRAKVASTMDNALKSPDTIATYERLGMEPYVLGPDETTAKLKETVAYYGNIIREANISYQP